MAELVARQRIPRRARRDGSRAWRDRSSGVHARTPWGRARLSETLEEALPDELDAKAECLMRRLCDKGLTVATAESCTGGMLAALFTDIEGAGHGFERGFVVYTKESKTELLGVDPGLLDRNEAVSEVVARAMAEGALKRSQADFAIGVTGFAGPAGKEHEEGLVHMALARHGGDTIHQAKHFGAIGRGPVRVKSLEAMLDMLERSLDQA
jgi:nicotinamide-nucleotide amidase